MFRPRDLVCNLQYRLQTCLLRCIYYLAIKSWKEAVIYIFCYVAFEYKFLFSQTLEVKSIVFYHSWTYQTEKELDGQSHWGRITSYGGGGFTMLLEPKKEETRKLIEVLMVSTAAVILCGMLCEQARWTKSWTVIGYTAVSCKKIMLFFHMIHPLFYHNCD